VSAAHAGAPSLNRLAVSATTHCLTGCAIGEVLGLVLATWWGWDVLPSIGLAVVLAFVAAYALTMRPLLGAGLSIGRALRIAFAADTLSIIVMETVDNGVILAIPSAMEAGLTDALFWGSPGVGSRDCLGGGLPGQSLAAIPRPGSRPRHCLPRRVSLSRWRA